MHQGGPPWQPASCSPHHPNQPQPQILNTQLQNPQPYFNNSQRYDCSHYQHLPTEAAAHAPAPAAASTPNPLYPPTGGPSTSAQSTGRAAVLHSQSGAGIVTSAVHLPSPVLANALEMAGALLNEDDLRELVAELQVRCAGVHLVMQ